MPNTTRLALPYPTLSAAADVPADLAALANSIDPRTVVFVQGTLSSRPAAGTAGRFFIQTDASPQHLFMDTGSAWVDIGPAAISAIPDHSITTVKLSRNTDPGGAAVGSANILDNNVFGNHILNGVITASKIADALKPSTGAVAATEALRALGTTAGTACAGDDPRLAGTGGGGGPPTGAAGGVLSGLYPNPGLAANAVATANIQTGAVTVTQLGANAVTNVKVDATLKPASAGGSAADTDLALRALGTGSGQAAAGNDSRLGQSIIPGGSVFPTTGLSDGMMFAFAAPTAAPASGPGVFWMMRYNAGTSKWNFVGGSDWNCGRDDFDALPNTPLTTGQWQSCAVDLVFTAPFTGDWWVEWFCDVRAPYDQTGKVGIEVAGVLPREEPPIGSAAPFHFAELYGHENGVGGAQYNLDLGASISKGMRIHLNNGETCRMKLRTLNAGQTNVRFGNKQLNVRPITT